MTSIALRHVKDLWFFNCRRKGTASALSTSFFSFINHHCLSSYNKVDIDIVVNPKISFLLITEYILITQFMNSCNVKFKPNIMPNVYNHKEEDAKYRSKYL